MRSEEIRKALKLDVREVPRVLKEGVAKKKLRSKGQKRATTYFRGVSGSFANSLVTASPSPTPATPHPLAPESFP